MGTFDYFRGEKSLFMHWDLRDLHWDQDLIMSLINLEYLVIMLYSIWRLKILLLLFYTHTQTHTKWIQLELSNTASQPAVH